MPKGVGLYKVQLVMGMCLAEFTTEASTYWMKEDHQRERERNCIVAEKKNISDYNIDKK